jgi:hypothetical protein
MPFLVALFLTITIVMGLVELPIIVIWIYFVLSMIFF